MDHLVTGEGELAQEPVEIALRLRPEEQLGLLDQQHERLGTRATKRFQASNERCGACSSALRVLALEVFARRARDGAGNRTRQQPAGTQRRGQEEHRHLRATRTQRI